MASAAKKTVTKSEKMPTLVRSFDFERDEQGQVRGFNKEKRTVRVQFSSEAGVKRWFGNEVLDHSPASVDLSRLTAGGAVLREHDTAQIVGVTESASITNKRTGEAEIRFAKTAAGEEAMQLVEDGILRSISVGYRVEKFEVDEDEEEYRAIRWQPLEISLVAIPADPSAKVFRNNQEQHQVMITRSIKSPILRAPADTEVEHEETEEQKQTREAAEQAERDANEATAGSVAEAYAIAHRYEKRYPGCVEACDNFIAEKKRGAELENAMRKFVLVKQQTDTRPEGRQTVVTDGKGNSRLLSYGEAFCQSEHYRKFGHKTGEKRTIHCSLEDRLQFRTTFSASTESLTAIQKIPGVPGILDQQQLMIADLFAQGETGGLTVRYIQEDSYTQAATAVAEGSAKPEATLNVSEVDATVRKIAVWTKVTDEMLSDFAQMSSFINARLAYMVQSLEDNHLLNGTGNTNQIKGVLNFTGLQTVSGATSPLDGVMKAIAYVRGANGSGFGEPDAIVMHPLDWMNAKLTKDNNGQYYGGGPFSGIYGMGQYSNVYNMWGLPCVVTTSIAQGTALVGAFRSAAQIFRRKGISIESTNSDNDDFQKNLVTIRAEERLALAVYQPKKFCTVTGIPAV